MRRILPGRRHLRAWLRRLRRTRTAGTSEPTVDDRAAWERFDPLAAAADLDRIVVSSATAVRAWLDRPPAAATYLHPVEPDPGSGARRRAARLLDGRFSPHTSVVEHHEPLPPAWDVRPDGRRTEEMYRHSLRWLEPLIAVAHADADAGTWAVVRDTVTSWIRGNARPPWRSPGAWHDHAVSIRVRILCWCFELHRRRADADVAFLRLLVASIHQHALYLADDATYAPRSNHALEANGSLLAVCATVPELRAVDEWAAVARRRLDHYTEHAFSDDGFSKEQSPRYHFFILRRLAALVTFLRAVGQPVPGTVRTRLHQATTVWPWLVRDDGSMPRVGDTNDPHIGHWRDALAATIDDDPPPAAPSTHPNPRGDAAALLVSFDAGYAVMRGAHPDADGPDTHVLFKCNYFQFPHYHHDGLSFVLYSAGREWLIDPGPHSYEYDRWERRYLVSSSAHNVVEVDRPFDVRPVELVDVARDAGGDRVSVRHRLGHADHTRTVTHLPTAVDAPTTPGREAPGDVDPAGRGASGDVDPAGRGTPAAHVRVVDEVHLTDGGRHRVRQLFHVHPDCEVDVDGRLLVLTAPDGRRCTIDQLGDGGSWEVVRGRREPEPLGWYSPRSLVIEPVPTCVWAVETGRDVRFETEIRVDGAVTGEGLSRTGASAARRGLE